MMTNPSSKQAGISASNALTNAVTEPHHDNDSGAATEDPEQPGSGKGAQQMPGWTVALFATACGLTVANLYYAQPIISVIARSLGLAPSAASMIVTLAQLGYCAGLVFLVPLGDLVENRRLVVYTQEVLVLALVTAAIAPTPGLFLMAMTFLGGSAVAAQMMLPIAAHMASESSRGHVVGTVMSGLLLGILLARPASILIADAFGWRTVFAASAALMAAVIAMLAWRLPVRRPAARHSYAELIGSLWTLWSNTPILRQRAIYQACLFGAFTLFWTAVPVQLASHPFGLSQRGIAIFSLAGALGALAAPIAGRLADRGWSRATTFVSLALAAAAFLLAGWGTKGSLAAMVAASVLLDIGVQANLVVGQRAIYSLSVDQRSRLNGLYIAIFFAGGALGSALASPLLAHGGGVLVSGVGLFFPLMALAMAGLQKKPEYA